jgi:serine/threonine protein kinase
VAYDFGVAGGCKESKEVIIKAWLGCYDDYRTERTVYNILSASPMKGCPSLIETAAYMSSWIYALVLEKLGPSLEDLCNLMTPNVRFDEKMTLALAIQMVCKILLVHKLYLLLTGMSCFYQLDRYADLHARNIIHNGVKPGNICISSLSSSATDASTLNLIDFGCSFMLQTELDWGQEFSGNKRFWSILSHHTYGEFFS